MRSSPMAPRAACSVAFAVVVLVGCGSSDKPTARPKDDPGPPVYAVKLTDAGCTPENFTLRPGDVEFRVTNAGSTKVQEMEVQTSEGHVIGDVEDVEPGHTRSFVMRLKPGTYRVRCPEEAPAGGSITVK